MAGAGLSVLKKQKIHIFLYTSKVYIFTYHTTTAVCCVLVCVVSIYSTVRTAVPCCILHTTAHDELPTMSIGKPA